MPEMAFQEQFGDSNKISQVVWQMRLLDLPRASNRARIDSLFNGFAPYTPAEVQQNRINTNVNDLTATRSAHAMRRQFSQAFLKPGNFFTVRLNAGPKHKRRDWGQIITEEINSRMKRGYSAAKYQEMLRNVFAQVTLHGVGPVSWPDKQSWCPTMFSMGDLMIPSMTYRNMDNLSYHAVYRRYTAAQLYRQTHGPRVDKGWKTDVADQCIQWALKQWGQTQSETDLAWNPERWEESIKSNIGFYSSDQVPTINVWDFRYTDLNDTNYGWKRKIVLDTPTTGNIATPEKDILGQDGSLLYDSGSRNYANKLSELVHFQFADGSVVAPFLYHSVRSLGFLLFSVCHLQNRLFCKFNDSVFESLLNYFRVTNPADEGRIDKIDLVNLGVIPEGWNFVTQNERWKIDQQLIQMAMMNNRGLVNDSAAAYNQNFGQNIDQGPEKTATQINAELNATSSMVGSMLQDAYGYQEFQYAEIARRFCIANSKDADVRAFRLACLKRGVPEDYLRSDLWDCSAERVIGAGNKQLEAASVQMLMQQINRYDPDAQRQILRLYTFSATDDASLSEDLVPEQRNTTTDSVHDAQVSAASLLMGLPLGLRQGVNHGEYAATLLGMLKTEIDKANQAGGMATMDQINGVQNLAGQTIEGEPIQGNGAANHIAILAQDETSKQDVKVLSDGLGKLMNEVKAFAQRLQEQQGQQGAQVVPVEVAPIPYADMPPDVKRQAEQRAGFQPSQQPEQDPKVAKAELALKLKAAQTQQKMEQQNASFELEAQRKEQSHQQELRHQQQRVETDVAATDLTTAAAIQREKDKPKEEVPA